MQIIVVAFLGDFQGRRAGFFLQRPSGGRSARQIRGTEFGDGNDGRFNGGTEEQQRGQQREKGEQKASFHVRCCPDRISSRSAMICVRVNTDSTQSAR